MAQTLETGLPDYRIRVSPRARRVRIRISPLGEVEVVLPPGFDPADVPRVLAERRDWLWRTRERLMQGARNRPETHGLQPRRVELQAIEEIWQVEYATDLSRKWLESRPMRRLILAPDRPAPHLRDWLQRRAREILPDWLRQTAAELGFRINRISVRGQKTRWGSCSTRHDISLNRNLLLLPAPTVRYLFIHELCHTRHLNHSAHFWQEVARHAPDYPSHERQLREAARSLPLWVHACAVPRPGRDAA